MPINFKDGETPIPRALYPKRDIGGGLNLKSSIFTVPDNQMVLLKNAYLVEDGSIIGRRGTLQWNISSLGAGAVNGATRAYLTTNSFLVQYSGTIYQGDDGTKTFTSRFTGWNSSALTWFLQYSGYEYATSSSNSDTPQKSSDGTTWTNMGIAGPTVAPSLAAGIAGVPNGTYFAEYTWVTGTIESNPSPISGSVTVVNQKIVVTGVLNGPA